MDRNSHVGKKIANSPEKSNIVNIFICQNLCVRDELSLIGNISGEVKNCGH